KYKDVESSLKIKEVDGLELVKKFSEDMETMLRRKVEAVQVLSLGAGGPPTPDTEHLPWAHSSESHQTLNLVEAAEEADLNHEFNESLVVSPPAPTALEGTTTNIPKPFDSGPLRTGRRAGVGGKRPSIAFQCMQFNYYNSVLLNEKDSSGAYVELGAEFLLEANAHFSNLLVNTTLSSVQLPTNVYNKDILNGIYMSEALNAVFVENFQRDPTLTWQYFGSSTGFFRIYPDTLGGKDQQSPVLVLLRTAPPAQERDEVEGQTDRNGEKSWYNDYIHYIEPCFKGILVQADRDNREHFKQLVDELMVKGVGVVDRALREAFQILQQFQEAGQGSLCNQAIMLITDGAVEDYEPVLEKYNWPDRKVLLGEWCRGRCSQAPSGQDSSLPGLIHQVRVFTYLIGREVSFADRLKWIACNNKGYYTQISTLADAQENVMEYLHVLSRPMVINHDHDITWTEAYMDSKVGPQGASGGSWVGEGWAEHLLGRHCGVTSTPRAVPHVQSLRPQTVPPPWSLPASLSSPTHSRRKGD
ncbi:hypothetical protein Celaphus_00013844, partial [Cervus elaphus hippelaphus]